MSSTACGRDGCENHVSGFYPFCQECSYAIRDELLRLYPITVAEVANATHLWEDVEAELTKEHGDEDAAAPVEAQPVLSGQLAVYQYLGSYEATDVGGNLLRCTANADSATAVVGKIKVVVGNAGLEFDESKLKLFAVTKAEALDRVC